MNRYRVIFIAGLLGCSVVGYGGYTYYENHHLCSDLRRTVTSATAPHNSDADVHRYLHDAKVQIRTKRDRAVESKFQEIEQIAMRDVERRQKLMAGLRDLNKEALVERLIRVQTQYRDDRIKVPQSLKDGIESGMNQWKEEIRQQKLDNERANKQALEDDANAKRLVAEISVDLGLPAVK